MKIGVLGAPGSGKSQFAHALAEELARPGRGFEDRPLVLDNYVRELRTSTGLEYGGFGTHIDDLQVVFKRREWELTWQRIGRSTITVGTALDSAVHCFVRSDEEARTRREVGLQAERLRTIAAIFGLLYTDTWDYDYAFWLRFKGDDHYGNVTSDGLAALIDAYHAPILTFEKDTPDDEKAQIAARAIAALESEQLSPPQERGVRRGSEASGADGDSVESMPDMPEQGRASDDA